MSLLTPQNLVIYDMRKHYRYDILFCSTLRLELGWQSPVMNR